MEDDLESIFNEFQSKWKLKHWILDEEGEPVEVELFVWAAWFAEHKERVVLQHRLPGARLISTVFLGIDHGFNFHPDALPVLWETMIFGGPFDSYQDRYTSRLDALRGHQRAVSLVEAFHSAPRKTKKALRKYGQWNAQMRPRERRRVARVLQRIGMD